jgi:hypothetical protein
MDVERADDNRLRVTSIDAHPRLKTPIAQLNSHEKRQESRGEGEHHLSRAILPSDRIRAVHSERVNSFRGAATLEKADVGMGRESVMDGDACETMSASMMLKELSAATSFTDPKEVKLSLSRDITNVMKPVGHVRASSQPQRSSHSIAGPLGAKSAAPKLPASESSSTLSRRSHSTAAFETGIQHLFRSPSPALVRALGIVEGKDDLARPRRVSSHQRLVRVGASAIQRKTF